MKREGELQPAETGDGTTQFPSLISSLYITFNYQSVKKNPTNLPHCFKYPQEHLLSNSIHSFWERQGQDGQGQTKKSDTSPENPLIGKWN